MTPDQFALIRYFIFETQCIGVACVVAAIIGLVCMGIMWPIFKAAPVMDVDSTDAVSQGLTSTRS